LVADSYGKYKPDISALFDQLCQLNQTFEQVNVQFYIRGDFNYISDSKFLSDPQKFINYPEIKQQYDSSSTNVFILKHAIKLGSGHLGAFYNPWSDVICITQGNGFQYALPGRMGYYFSLERTFGEILVAYSEETFGNPVFSEYLILEGDTIRLEAVNGSNCELTGDFICDTPPDYNFSLFTQSQGLYCTPFYKTHPVLDFNLDTIKSPYNNLMANFECAKIKISPMQGKIIDIDISERAKDPLKKGYLELSSTPPPAIVEFPDIIEPQDQNYLFTSGFVPFSWSLVPGATTYLFQISWFGGSKLESFILSGNIQSFILPFPLESYRLYRWKVIPFNPSGFCDPSREDGWNEFTTGDEFLTFSTLVTTISTKIKVVSPTKSGSPICLYSNQDYDFKANVELFNNQGQLFYSEKNLLFAKGNGTLLKNHPLIQGVYYININSEKLFQTLPIIIIE